MYTIGSFLQEKDLPGLKLMAGGDHLQVEVISSGRTKPCSVSSSGSFRN